MSEKKVEAPERKVYDLAYAIVEQMGLGLEFRNCRCGQFPCARLRPIVDALAKREAEVRADLLHQPRSERCGESILRPLCVEHPHIEFVEGVLGGVQPLINRRRVGVSHLLSRMATGMPLEEYKETWGFDDETLKDAFAYAQDVIDALIERERECVFPATGAPPIEKAAQLADEYARQLRSINNHAVAAGVEVLAKEIRELAVATTGAGAVVQRTATSVSVLMGYEAALREVNECEKCDLCEDHLPATVVEGEPRPHWPFTAKHANCAECNREYEPSPLPGTDQCPFFNYPDHAAICGYPCDPPTPAMNDALDEAARIAYDMIVSGRSAKEVSVAIHALKGVTTGAGRGEPDALPCGHPKHMRTRDGLHFCQYHPDGVRVAPTPVQPAAAVQYRECALFADRGFHDWRWAGWPLTDPACEEKWCDVCGLIKQAQRGAWVEAGYRKPSTSTPGEGAREPTPGADGRYCTHHDDDLAHTRDCYKPDSDPVAQIAEAMSYCGPLRLLEGHETTYIFGFDTAKAIKIIERHFPPTETTQVAVNDAATEICDYCGIDTNDGEKVAAIISKHCTANAGEVERRISPVIIQTQREWRIWLWNEFEIDTEISNDDARAALLQRVRDSNNDYGYLRNTVIPQKIAAALANAIRDSRDAIAGALRAVKETYIPVNRALEISVTTLESLTKKSGDDGPTRDK